MFDQISPISLAFGLSSIAVLYIIPGVVACYMRRRNATAIVVLNLLLGWTFVGWVVALVWALVEDRFPDSL